MSSVHRIQARLPKKTIKFGKKMINKNAPPATKIRQWICFGVQMVLKY